MSDASFVLYTGEDEYDGLNTYFYDDYNVSKEQLVIKRFELSDTKYRDRIIELKDIDEAKTGDRCVEIQYNKFRWMEDEIDDEHTHFYWIDAGLSHTGLFPPKYKIKHGKNSYRNYFDFTLFNNKFLSNLVDTTGDKIYAIGRENAGKNFWSPTLPEKYYKQYDSSIHIIGGLFGGKRDNVIDYIETFNKLLVETLDNGELYWEEAIMSTLYFNDKDKFELGHFEIWWYDANGPLDSYPPGHEFYSNHKSFYEIFEALQ